MIVRSGIQSVVMMTVSDMNYMELRDVMDTVEKAGADAFGFLPRILDRGVVDALGMDRPACQQQKQQEQDAV